MIAKPSLFLERMILFLKPYFLTITSDHDLVRAEILETLSSYGARTRSEVLNAVQIIAFGFTALDMLAESKAIKEMSPSLRLRFRSCANGLNRSGQQNEKILAKRLACDVPDAAAPKPDPIDDVSEADIEETLQQARDVMSSYTNRLSSAHPATGQTSQRDRKRGQWTGAMMDKLGQSGGNPGPAAQHRQAETHTQR